MTKLHQVYKCNVCGNMVTIIHEGAGQLVCCGQPMELIKEKTEDVGQEKHLPAIERLNGKLIVKIGVIPHPMEEGHHIEWIAVFAGNKIYDQYLKPGDEPMAEFNISDENVEVWAYCNIHGLWKK
jgi:superoxide reductase